jgi:transposase-like protein
MKLEETEMKEKMKYTEAFRNQSLQKVYSRGERSVKAVAEELNINHWTLKNWMNTHKERSISEAGEKRPQDWSLAERLQMLLDSHGLDEEAVNGFCRERGIFGHHLQHWREAFESGTAAGLQANRSELRELKEANKGLRSELNRKDKALAEAAALLVLQKKYQALWEDGDG